MMRFLAPTLTLALMLHPAALRSAEPDLTPVKQWIDRARSLNSVAVEFTQERYLRAVTKPLVSTGRMWFKAPGALRWQLGEPPKLIALQQTRDGELTILDPKKRQARVLSPDTLREKGGPFSLIEASFPTSIEAFQEKFRIASVLDRDGLTEVSCQVRDRRMNLAVLKLLFRIDPSNHRLHSLEIWFHDGSRIVNLFSQVTENQEVAERLFVEPTDGWKIARE